MKNTFILILLINLYFFVSAQTDFREGYIVSSNLDTVNGMIDFHGDIMNSRYCTFKDQANIITRYEPGKIVSYRYINGKYYISKIIRNTDNSVQLLFVEYLVQGKKNLYYYRNETGNHYMFDIRKDTLAEIPYYEKMIYEDQSAYIFESRKHIAYLKAYFSDCPALFKDIDKIKAPGINNLVSITKEYHHLQCNDSSCIVYYKPVPRVKIAFEPVVGAIQFHSDYLGHSNYTTMIGGFFYLWLPRSNENIYFKTGVLFPFLNDLSINRIPLQLEYLFPCKLIQPKFDFGMDIYREGSAVIWMPAIAAGALMKLSKSFYFDVDFESDLCSLNFEPKFFITHAFRTGIYIRF
jgi:hypothetical protein